MAAPGAVQFDRAAVVVMGERTGRCFAVFQYVHDADSHLAPASKNLKMRDYSHMGVRIRHLLGPTRRGQPEATVRLGERSKPGQDKADEIGLARCAGLGVDPFGIAARRFRCEG